MQDPTVRNPLPPPPCSTPTNVTKCGPPPSIRGVGYGWGTGVHRRRAKRSIKIMVPKIAVPPRGGVHRAEHRAGFAKGEGGLVVFELSS